MSKAWFPITLWWRHFSFFRGKFLDVKIDLHFQCSKKLSQTKTNHTPDNYCFDNNRPDQAAGRPLSTNLSIALSPPRDVRKKSDWFRGKKILQNLKYLNFTCDQSQRYFLSNAKNFSGNRRKVWAEIRPSFSPTISSSNLRNFEDSRIF